MGCYDMANDRTEIEDGIILAAREHAANIFERLVMIANADPPTHVSLKAAELIIKLSREETSEERDPPLHKWF